MTEEAPGEMEGGVRRSGVAVDCGDKSPLFCIVEQVDAVYWCWSAWLQVGREGKRCQCHRSPGVDPSIFRAEHAVDGGQKFFGRVWLHQERNVIHAGGVLDLVIIHEAARRDDLDARIELSQNADRCRAIPE